MTHEYVDQIISFLDILGFADAIERSATDPALTAEIRRALTLAPFSSPLLGPPNYPAGMSYSASVVTTNFSDSLVVSAEKTVSGLLTVIEMSRAFACVLLQMGMLVRGGVSSGFLIHEDHILFGPGMVSAYRLESQTAKVARIILDSDTSNFARACGHADEVISDYLNASLRTDDDSLTYLHVLRELMEDVEAKKNDQLRQDWWGTVRKTISDQLVATRGKPFANKVEWFGRYYNKQIEGSAEHGGSDNWLTPLAIISGG